MQFKTFKPIKFTHLIDCFWTLEHYGKPVELLTPPAQYLNLSFSIGSDYCRNEKVGNSAVIEGLSFNSNRTTYFDKTKVYGIRFYPYGLYAFFPELSKSLINDSFSLESVLAEFTSRKLINKLRKAESELEIVHLLTDFLSSFYNRRKCEKTRLVEEGYSFFHCPDEIGSVNDFVQTSSSNYTTLNRHFKEITGIPTKKMERLIKFRKALCSLTNTKLSLTQIAYKAGYFDQSHFIREFTLFMNMKPKAYQKTIGETFDKSYKFNYNFSLL